MTDLMMQSPAIVARARRVSCARDGVASPVSRVISLVGWRRGTYTDWCTAFLNADPPHVLPAVSASSKPFRKPGFMSTPYTRWVLSACWIALVMFVFIGLDASSGRSWLYFATVALGPPVALVRLWPEAPRQTLAEIMHDRGDRI